ncbi:helix-turn-helix domain-containing protein [Bacillus cereus]|uniref:HTH cro/C1-type domain-containing protein n=1 Tax=Bacillus cereus TaxID=1396 RepID=A0A2A7HXS2_BACCE|nr:helix-turn-helix transcriptional regulator [Bacillus cereus]PEC21710.1 hypothetical protein COM96_12525 [Bacillus cereus]
MIFSERLKEEREKRNWSQNDLAEKIHVSRQSVSKWKVFFDSLFMMGVLLFITKIVVWVLNKFAGANITIVADAPYVMNFLPLILMVIGGMGSDKLKKIYR